MKQKTLGANILRHDIALDSKQHELWIKTRNYDKKCVYMCVSVSKVYVSLATLLKLEQETAINQAE